MIGQFPFNSCETASLLLGKAMKSVYPSKEIWFVDGKCRDGRGRHFWIEVDNLCFDLTADQFKDIDSPFYGVDANDHTAYFVTSSKTEIDVQLKKNDFYTSKIEQFDLTIRRIISA